MLLEMYGGVSTETHEEPTLAGLLISFPFSYGCTINIGHSLYIYEFYLMPSSVSKQGSISLLSVQSYVLNHMNQSYIVQMLVSNDIFSKGSQCFCGTRILLKLLKSGCINTQTEYLACMLILHGLDCWICFLGLHGLQYASSGWIIGLGNMSLV